MKPLVVDDTLYAYTYEGTFAMDARTGEVLWNNSRVNGTYLGGMAYDEGRVFVSTADDGLKALDASTGAITWTRGDISTVDTAPVVLNDTVFIGGDDSDMWALDPATGATVWNHTYADNGLPADFSSPTAANGRVFVPGSDGTLYAHSADDGSVLWTRDIGYSEATPAVKDGIVYAADSGAAPYLQALDAETGETVWNATAGFGYTGLAVADDTVFMATCGDSMFAYDATTGELRWNRSGIGCAYDVSEPVVASGVVYSTTYGNRTVALDAGTGETVYDFEMPGCCKGTSPVPYEGRLYVADRFGTGEVYAFGGPEWPRVLPDRALVNESTELTVLREYRDEPIPNATLRIDGTTLTTDENGTATYTFDSGGTREVVVTAPDTDRTDYVETRRTVTVDVSGFAVTLDSTNSPVEEGETLTVDATVENTGETQETQTVTLSIAGAVRDSANVTLSPGDSQSVALSWTTGSGDAGDYTARVDSDDDSDSTPVSVETVARPNFSVAITSTNSPIDEGETLNASVTVTNTGDLQGTQTVALSVAGTQRDSTTLTLAPGATRVVSLSWETTIGDGRSEFRSARVTSDNDSDSTSVSVVSLEPANFSVVIASTNSPVEEGETLNVSVNVTNTGDLEGTQTITLSADGSGISSKSVTLGGGESRSVTLSWTPVSGDAGSYTVTLASANDSASTAVTIESTDETETVAPGQPGFGIVAVTVALLVATLFARRRHGR
jgi:PGF-CTERM protein